jgi:Holliday junction resolvase-like predicted endonuclease|tara:strand:- start:1623 stop:1910 length:288 start_codon:yes stop_codon:yes gene_type:complete
MLTEKHLQNYLFKLAEANGIYCRKMETTARRGFPDVMMIHNGKVVFVELKSPSTGGSLSKLQERELKRLSKAGANTFVTNTKEGVDNVVAKLIDA